MHRGPFARFVTGPATAALVALSILGCDTPAGTGGPAVSGGAGSAAPTFVEGPGGSGGPTGAPGPSGLGTAATPTRPVALPWAEVESALASPSAREDHTWTVAEGGHDAWLFGGRDGGTVYDDLWAFNLGTNAWRRVVVQGVAPAARFGHEAAWVPGLGLVVFGGQAGSTFFDDLWLFAPDPGSDSGSWRLLPPGGGAPIARYGSCSGIGPDGRFWISHGFTSDGVRFADTLAYDFASESWSDQAPATERPVERCLHACWWRSDGRLALYGGQTTGVPALGDLWFLTPGSGAATNRWSEAAGQAPDPRQLPAIARHGNATFLFGGRGTDRAALGETWLATDAGTGFERFQTPGGDPPARSGATLIDDLTGDRLLLFGGLGSEAFGDLWELSFR